MARPDMGQLSAELAALRREFDQLRERVGGAVEWTTLARVNASGQNDFADTAGNPDDRQRPIRRVSPWGLAGRPVVGVLAAIVKAGTGVFSGINVGIGTDKYGPQSLEDGETMLYNKGTTQVFLDKDDKLILRTGDPGVVSQISLSKGSTIAIAAAAGAQVTIDAGAGADVVVNGGTKKVARLGDAVAGTCPNTGTGIAVNITAAISAGAANFKG